MEKATRVATLEERRWQGPGIAVFWNFYKGFMIPPHAHPEVQVVIPLQGRLCFQCEGWDLLVGPEAAVIIGPGVTHSVLHLDGEVQFVALEYAPSRWPGTPPAGLTALDAGHLWANAQQMQEELGEKEPSELILASAADLAAAWIAKRLANVGASSKATDSQMVQAVDYLLRHFDEPLRTPALAERWAMSPRQFERRFKAATGENPHQFLIRVRIAAAKERLVSTDQSVAEIAYQVGFQNVSHFSDTFKRQVGMPPIAYRAQHQNRDC